MDSGKLPVITSEKYLEDIRNILQYGKEAFGYERTLKFHAIIKSIINNLDSNYLMYPEFRFLSTKSKIYRNIILESYLIIYRITSEKIEVLRAFHSSRCSRRKIQKTVRKTKI